MIVNVKARYADGVLTPLEPLDLDEGKEVILSIEDAEAAGNGRAVLGQRPGVHPAIVREAQELRSPGRLGRSPHRLGQEQKTLPLRIPRGDDGLMRTLFADAGYWIALLYSGDQLHERATTVAAGLEPVAIVTTQMALAEALNHLAGRGERLRRLAAQMVRELEARSDVQVIPQTDASSGLL